MMIFLTEQGQKLINCRNFDHHGPNYFRFDEYSESWNFLRSRTAVEKCWCRILLYIKNSKEKYLLFFE